MAVPLRPASIADAIRVHQQVQLQVRQIELHMASPANSKELSWIIARFGSGLLRQIKSEAIFAYEVGSGKLSEDTVFQIGSVTKISTALLLEGMVKLGTGSFSGMSVGRNGSPEPPAAECAIAAYPTSKVYDFLSQYHLTRDIGRKWEYSNLGFALLGNALARRAGRDYASLVKERITDPLRMKSTSIKPSPECTLG